MTACSRLARERRLAADQARLGRRAAEVRARRRLSGMSWVLPSAEPQRGPPQWMIAVWVLCVVITVASAFAVRGGACT